MKTILVPTDFSECADNAAHYALELAKVLRADIKLCNAMKVPSETYLADTVVWPLENYASIKESVTCDLKLACNRLQRENHDNLGAHTYPRIDFCSDIGEVTDVVKNRVDAEKIPLVVMGMSGAGALSKLFLGSNSQDMIEKAHFPLLLIPHEVKYKPVRKVAFATDMNAHDLDVVYSVIDFARKLDAEVMIAHVTGEKYEGDDDRKKIDNFLSDLTCKANYDKMYYRNVKAVDVEHGLDWICEHSFSDIIVMSHGQHNIIDSFFTGSYTKKLARHVNIPLMVYPKHVKTAALTVF